MTDIDIGKLRVAAENAPKGAWSQGCMIGFIHTVRPPVVLAILTEIEALREVATAARAAIHDTRHTDADGIPRGGTCYMGGRSDALADTLARLAAVQETPAP